MTYEEQRKVLEEAIETYGNANQILVCIEELNELACVLAKYPRYDNEKEAREKLLDAVLDEVADVYIILNHVKTIFELDKETINARIEKKIKRLKRWLMTSNSMQQTLVDRTVGEVECKNCEHWKNPDYSMCHTCMSTEGTEGIKPFYSSRR